MRALVLTLASTHMACLAGRALSDTAAADAADSNGNMTAAPGGSQDHLPMANACMSNAPPPQAVRRLTPAEINNTVADLFADAAAPQTTTLFAGDATRYGFDNVQEALTVSDNAALELTLYAEAVGTYAGGRAALLSPGCQVADANCLGALVDSLGTRAFRRPVTAAEKANLLSLVVTGSTFPTAVASVVTGMLQMPGFLYRTELGSPNGSGAFRLTPYEVAALLSYTYTASLPDAQLMAAAAAGELSTPAQLEAQGVRLLALPRARAAIERFFAQWLLVAGLPLTVRSEGVEVLDDATKAQMVAETQAFVDDVVFDNPGTVHDLYRRDKTTLGAQLAAFYGAPAAGPAQPTALGRVAGVLGQGGVLSVASQATYASPTLRGRMVRMRLLCGSVPVPPAGVPPLGEGAADATLRQRSIQHTTNPSCAVCHDQLDPLGYALGNFDTLGRVRVGGMEHGQPVDTTGFVIANFGSTDTAKVSVSDAAGLAAFLADSPQAQDCLVRHWSMYSFGHVTWAQDSCVYDAAAASARASGASLRGVLLSPLHAPGFFLRGPPP